MDHSSENHDRWLVSYADFVTLLFAFFVLMFASSRMDAVKVKALSQSVNNAFQGRSTGSEPGTVNNLAQASEVLTRELANEIASGKIGVAMESRGLVISLQESAFFPSASDALLPAAVPSINTIARVIGKLPNAVRLEGHTDSKPISNIRFRNNWELAAARGIAVLQSFSEQHGISAARLAVVSYADTIPKANNDLEEGRAVNRRVDVTILNEQASRRESPDRADGQKNAFQR
jgi:chemotaxis protein MotB